MNALCATAAETAEAVATLLAAGGPVAVDLEADGMWAFRPRICVVQLAGAPGVTIVDPLAETSVLAALRPLFAAGGPTLLFHDSSTDARLLADSDIDGDGPIEDTQIYAKFLGYSKLGLSSLAESLLGVRLDKSLQTHDWRARPLTDAHRVYLAGDVAHLHALYMLLAERAAEEGILWAIREETRYVRVQARAAVLEGRATPAWARVKGIGAYPEPLLARLRPLAAARAAIAARRDRPEARVIPTEQLLFFARHPEAIDPSKLRGRLAGEEVALLVEAAREARGVTAIPEDERRFLPLREPEALSRARQRREAALSRLRADLARPHGDDAARWEQIALPGHCLRDIARIGPSSAAALLAIPGVGEERVARYGAAILAAIAEAE